MGLGASQEGLQEGFDVESAAADDAGGAFAVTVRALSSRAEEIGGLRPSDTLAGLCERAERAFEVPCGRARLCKGSHFFTEGDLYSPLSALGISEGTELTLVRKAMSGEVEKIGTDQLHRGAVKWLSGVASGSSIYFAPMNAPSILVFGLVSSEVRGIPTGSVCTGDFKWACGVEVNGCIYWAPRRAPCVLKLNTRTGRVSGIATRHLHEAASGTGEGSWYGAVAVGKTVFFSPMDAQCVLELDTETGSMSTLSTEGISVDQAKWGGGVAVKGSIFFAPRGASCILQLDVESRQLRGIDTDAVFAGHFFKWGNPVLACGCIYFAAARAPCILKYDLEAGTVHGISTEGISQRDLKWVGGGELDGQVFFAPLFADCLLRLEPRTESLSSVPLPPPELPRMGCWGGCTAALGNLYFAPLDAPYILKLS